MLNLLNPEMLATLTLDQCWFYPDRVSDRLKIAGLIRLFCEDIITGMPVGERCVFFIKNKDFVKLLKSGSGGWELEVLTITASEPFLALEWVTQL